MRTGELVAFILYLIGMLGVGVAVFFKNRGGGEKEFFLGGRNMNPWAVALSAQASDMSAWLLMGLPGSILAFGMGQVWIAIGLLIGTILNWIFTAPRLRAFSQVAGDAITVPQYLSGRFRSKHKTLQVVSAIVFFVCFAVYAASSFKACGTLFHTVIGIDETLAALIAAVIIVSYTFLGGFAAVCWTDFFQGMLMLVALLLAPIFALQAIEAGAVEGTAVLAENYWSLLPSGKLDWQSWQSILSGLAWGLGYFGMPHILVRFMSISTAKEIKRSRSIAIVWIILALGAAVAVGLVGRVYLPTLADGDRSLVFIHMVRNLFPPLVSGVLLSAILAASMSTADSQLLVSASAFTSDVYKPIFRKKADNKEMMLVSRLVVVCITIAAFLIAINPNSGDIMDLVENAWAGFGSAFGPVILLSLYWKKMTYKGAVAGIVGGALTDVLWMLFLSASTGIYELLPGFLIGGLCAIVGSKLDKRGVPEDVDGMFQDVDAQLH
ncbi:MAG: sodium/proline symporter PutP [Eubacteriales bacterium]|nr:sodium/proline symporter PutP [Eubacteriales bacterium]